MKIGAIRVSQPGGPEVLRWEEIELGAPGAGQVQIRHAATGINFIEIYHRTGLYPQPLPFIPGNEAAGTITAVGPGVTDFKEGDRVAYCTAPLGAYAEARNCPADRLVHLPSWIGFDQAAAMMLKGLTAQYLLRRTYPVGPGSCAPRHRRPAAPCSRRPGRLP
jgi:NADPH:quinone reductase